MAETLFTDIIENLGKTKINITGSGGKSGKEQIQNAPSGITSNKETINIAGSAEIPITNNVDFLLDGQYNKFRDKIEQGDNELFLQDAPSNIDRKVGIGFNKGGEGFSGYGKYGIDSGEPELFVKYKKTFADGGRINFDSGGSPLQQLRQSLVDDLMYKFPSMKEEDMQMVVRDINLDMSPEEAQASMSSNFTKIFGSLFSTGGRVGYATAGVVDPDNNIKKGQDLGAGIKQKATRYKTKNGILKNYFTYTVTVGGRGQPGYIEQNFPKYSDAVQFRKIKLQERGLLKGGKETITWDSVKNQRGFLEYMDSAMDNNQNLKQAMKEAGLTKNSPKEKIFKEFKRIVSDHSAIGAARKKIKGRRLPSGSFTNFMTLFKNSFQPNFGLKTIKDFAKDLPISAATVKSHIYDANKKVPSELDQSRKAIETRSRIKTSREFLKGLKDAGIEIKRVGSSFRVLATKPQIAKLNNDYKFNIKDGVGTSQLEKFSQMSKKTPEWKKQRYAVDLSNLQKLIKNMNNKLKDISKNGTDYKALRKYIKQHPKLRNMIEAKFDSEKGKMTRMDLDKIKNQDLFRIVNKNGKVYIGGKAVIQGDHIRGRETVIYDPKTKKIISGSDIEYPKNYSILTQNMNNNVKRSVENWIEKNPKEKKKIKKLESWFLKNDVSYYDKKNKKIRGAKPTKTSTDIDRLGIDVRGLLQDKSVSKTTKLPVIDEGEKLLNKILERDEFHLKNVKDYSNKTGVSSAKMYSSIVGNIDPSLLGIEIPESVKNSLRQIANSGRTLLRGLGKATLVVDPIFAALDASEASGKGASGTQIAKFVGQSFVQDALNLPNVIAGASKYASDFLKGERVDDLKFKDNRLYDPFVFADKNLDKGLASLTKEQRLRNIADLKFNAQRGSMTMVDDMEIPATRQEIDAARELNRKNYMGPFYKGGLGYLEEKEKKQKKDISLIPSGLYSITTGSNEV